MLEGVNLVGVGGIVDAASGGEWGEGDALGLARGEDNAEGYLGQGGEFNHNGG